MTDWITASWDAPNSIIAGTTLRSAKNLELPLLGKPCWLNQIHGDSVITATHYNKKPEADASISGDSGYFCVVQTADCLPVLFCSNDGSAYAAAHAGWRGLAAGILENVVKKITIDASELIVWLGPAISQSSFEVGVEVRNYFINYDPSTEIYFISNEGGQWFCDLYALAHHKLKIMGIARIFGGYFCTYN
ncbi:MAG: hypothetical protein CMQ54_04470, partial [Gammaproteobacteria bacterium]|nr:hypothetical protein [Gammaproteobacteria bacterium]